MRLCRYDNGNGPEAGFYFDDTVIPVIEAATAHFVAQNTSFLAGDSLLDFLPGGKHHEIVVTLHESLADHPDLPRLETADIRLLLPNPRPNKLFLLAGNYAKHIEEGGGIAAEREETFPYVFMKPPTTTLTDPGAPVQIPKVSPDHIDWELELGVVIGKGGSNLKAIGMAARHDLEELLGRKVYLELYVRQQSRWRESAATLAELERYSTAPGLDAD